MATLIELMQNANGVSIQGGLGMLAKATPRDAAKANTESVTNISGMQSEIGAAVATQTRAAQETVVAQAQTELSRKEQNAKKLVAMFDGLAGTATSLMQSASDSQQKVAANEQEIAKLARESEASWNPLKWMTNSYKIGNLEDSIAIENQAATAQLTAANQLVDSTVQQAAVLKTQESMLNGATTRIAAEQANIDLNKDMIVATESLTTLAGYDKAREAIFGAKSTELANQVTAANADYNRQQLDYQRKVWAANEKDIAKKAAMENVLMQTFATVNGTSVTKDNTPAMQLAVSGLSPAVQARLGSIATSYASQPKETRGSLNGYLIKNLTVADWQELAPVRITNSPISAPINAIMGIGGRTVQSLKVTETENFLKQKWQESQAAAATTKEGKMDYTVWRKSNGKTYADEADKYATAIVSQKVAGKTVVELLQMGVVGNRPSELFRPTAAIPILLALPEVKGLKIPAGDFQLLQGAFASESAMGSVKYREAILRSQAKGFSGDIAKVRAIKTAMVDAGVSSSTVAKVGAKIFELAQRDELKNNPDFAPLMAMGVDVRASLLLPVHDEHPEVVRDIATPAGFDYMAYWQKPKDKKGFFDRETTGILGGALGGAYIGAKTTKSPYGTLGGALIGGFLGVDAAVLEETKK